jgi:hypothetical protein
MATRTRAHGFEWPHSVYWGRRFSMMDERIPYQLPPDDLKALEGENECRTAQEEVVVMTLLGDKMP